MKNVFTIVCQLYRNSLKRSEAKSFTKCQDIEEAFDSKDRGTQIVLLENIVGSVGRYHDFDSRFRLHQHLLTNKPEHVKGLMRGSVTLSVFVSDALSQ